MNIATWVERNGRRLRSAPALAAGEHVHADWGQFAATVASLAGGLRGPLAMSPGDRVAIVMDNRPEYLEAQFAAWHAGLVAVPVNARLHREEIAYILEHSATSVVIVDDEHAEVVAPLLHRLESLQSVVLSHGPEWDHLRATAPVPLVDREAHDPAWLFYTSGTTGRPKGATLTHGNLLMASLSYYADIGAVSARDSVLHAAPLSHGSGLYGLPHVAKGAVSVFPASGSLDGAELTTLVERWPGLSFFAAPIMLSRLAADPALVDASAADTRGASDVAGLAGLGGVAGVAGLAGLAGLKTIIYGGAPMYLPDLERALATFGPRLAQIYGQGETPMTITSLSMADHADRDHPRWEARMQGVGFARTDVEVRVVDGDDQQVPVGALGEVVVRGAVVMSGYWNEPEASREALRGGWLHTGDVGSFDEDGFLTLHDRSKDLIISGGMNIYPREVEEARMTHPGVQSVAVVGRPDPAWGESVVAFVVVSDGAELSQADLDRTCLERIARFKRPKEYHFVETLPVNNYGKVLKRELRSQLTDGTLPGQR
jgi:acyl-CoA synthetase (AMP-forming)/AMP-acid ligase II